LTIDDYIRKLEESLLRIQDLEKENESLKKHKEALEKLKEQLEKENENLKNRLLFYENPNTPPSARKTQKEEKTSTENIPVPKKRGAPNVHRGATRHTKEPDEIKEVIADHCEKCNSSNIEKQDKCESVVIEDLPPSQKIKTTQYNRWEVKCKDCDHQFVSKGPDCPKEGKFGIYLMVYIVMLKLHLRGVIRKIQDFLLKYNDFEISPKGINDVILRAGSACKNDYEEKIKKIRSAAWRYIDETGIKINGENWWLWIFRTNTNETLVVIRKSRGKKVLEEILGPEHKGANISDGWKAYSWIDTLQRCCQRSRGIHQ
jgi:transposase